MPKSKNWKPPYYAFKNFHKLFMVPIVGYFDFESFLRKIRSDRVYDEDTKSYTEKFQQHIPSGFAMIYSNQLMIMFSSLNFVNTRLNLNLLMLQKYLFIC